MQQVMQLKSAREQQLLSQIQELQSRLGIPLTSDPTLYGEEVNETGSTNYDPYSAAHQGGGSSGSSGGAGADDLRSIHDMDMPGLVTQRQ